jgi:YjbE family integral membrane protein
MEFLLTPAFYYALGAIVLIDLVLAGDNAIVIALAARSLPAQLRKKAILWGTVGAIVVRSLMTLAVVWLLKIPGLLLIGGVLLLWIAVKLLTDESGEDDGSQVSTVTFWGAMRTIVVADALMGLDNVLAVAGAAHGNYLLVGLGLVISIPVVVWGSGLVLKLIERFPVFVSAGAAVLAGTAVKMALSEPLIESWVEGIDEWHWLVYVAVIAAVLAAGRALKRRRAHALPV